MTGGAGAARAGRPSPLTATTWGDRALVVLLAAASLAGIALAGPSPAATTATVRVDGRVAARLPLAADRRLAVRGPLGETEIVVERGAARIVASPCRRKVCVGMGRAARRGDLLVCVPNHVVVEVDGREPGAPDAILR
jgi:hypothetical protein